jgi:pilus assembly protein CpaE
VTPVDTKRIERPLSIGLLIPTVELRAAVSAALQGLSARIVTEVEAGVDDSAAMERIQESTPELLLVELAALEPDPAAAIAKLKSLGRHPAVIVVHARADAKTILRALRAGADEFLHPPFQHDLSDALDRIAARRNETRGGGQPGRVLGFVSAKGGCGATTVACHLAAEIKHLSAQPVLLADFDIEDGMAAFFTQCESRYTVVDALKNLARLDKSLWGALVSRSSHGIDVLASPARPDIPRREAARELRRLISFVRELYPWTIIDLGRSLNPMLCTLADELDEIYVVTSVDIPALHRSRRLLQDLEQFGSAQSRARVVINHDSQHAEMSAKELGEMLRAPIAFSLPEEPKALYDALTEGKLVDSSTRFGRKIQLYAAKLTGAPAVEPERRKILFLF